MIRFGVWALLFCLLHGVAEAQMPVRNPADPIGEMLRQASMLIEQNRLEEAGSVLRRAADIEPQALDVGFNISNLLIKQQRYRAAIRLMERLLQQYPASFPVMNNLSWVYATATDLSVRDGERAVALAQSALLIQPNSFHVWNTLSEAHYIIGNYDRALRAAEEAIRAAQRAGASADRLVEYRQQASKSRMAMEAESILNQPAAGGAG